MLVNPLVRLVSRVAAPLQAKLLGAFLAIVALLLMLGGVGLRTLSGMNQRTEALIRSEHKIEAYRQVQLDTTNQLYRISSALLVADQKTLDNALRQLDAFQADLDRLRSMASGQDAVVTQIRKEYDKFVAVVKRVVELTRGGNVDQAWAAQLTEAQPLAQRLKASINKLADQAEASTLADIQASGRAYRYSQAIFIALAVGSILLALYLGRTLSQSLIGPIREIEARLSEIAAGDFSQHVTVGNRDELGALAANVNRTSEELGRLYRELETASQHKSAFLANMSHELRTPLNAIIGYSEMLYETAEDEGQEAYLADLEKIGHAGRHLLGLINDILDLSKIEAGKMEVYLEDVDLAGLLAEVRSIVEPLAAANDNRLEIAAPSGLGSLRTDRTKLKQGLLNLLSNASKFTRDGRLTLEVRRGADEVSFIVADTGIGMSEEQLGRLFQAFSQADASTTRRFGGTGLGLAITKHFCEMLGGRIAVESKPDEGSTFTITLPVDGAAPRAAPVEPPVPEILPAAAEDAALVMVVDDDAQARSLLVQTVRREGYRVIEAADGEAALDLAREHRPDVITLDVLMPRVDGWAVLSALKSDPELTEIPVIVVTVLAERGIARSLGAAEFMTKPVDRARLAAVIRENVRGSGTVLVVDDDPESRALARRHLDRLGCAAAEAADGNEALAWLADHPRPAMILLDLMMPRLDGFGFLEEVAKHAEWREIPVVILTAMEIGAAERERLAGRTREVLAKGADDLAAAMRRTLVRPARTKHPVGAG